MDRKIKNLVVVIFGGCTTLIFIIALTSFAFFKLSKDYSDAYAEKYDKQIIYSNHLAQAKFLVQSYRENGNKPGTNGITGCEPALSQAMIHNARDPVISITGMSVDETRRQVMVYAQLGFEDGTQIKLFAYQGAFNACELLPSASPTP